MSYVNAHAIVEAEWLADQLTDPAIRILDATYALPGSGADVEMEFARAHIPGAQFFSIERIADETNDLPHMLPAAPQFAAQVGALGVGTQHRVIVYDQADIAGAARAWWMFRAMGHENVAVLNGGLKRWQAEGHVLTDKVEPPAPAAFQAELQPHLVWSREQVYENMLNGSVTPLDARSEGRFTGKDSEPRIGLRQGHIPGALNVPYRDLINPATGKILAPEKLAHRFAQAEIGPEEEIYAYCGSGVSSCVIALGLYLIGKSVVPVYDGSWADWGSESGPPIVMGPAKRLKAPEEIEV